MTNEDSIIFLETLKTKINGAGIDEVFDMAIEALEKVQPDRAIGEWKQISLAKIYECSICGQIVLTDDICCYKYCHGCGAKMLEGDGEESEG